MTEKHMRLAVPSGWAVLQNKWLDIDPEGDLDFFQAHFAGELLWIASANYLPEKGWQVLTNAYDINLGWFPGGDPNGQFRLVVYHHDWNNDVKQFESRDRHAVRDQLEAWLAQYAGKQ